MRVIRLPQVPLSIGSFGAVTGGVMVGEVWSGIERSERCFWRARRLIGGSRDDALHVSLLRHRHRARGSCDGILIGPQITQIGLLRRESRSEIDGRRLAVVHGSGF